MADDPTTRGADLAEEILHQVSGVDQHWQLIATLARQLAELADEAASNRPDSSRGHQR